VVVPPGDGDPAAPAPHDAVDHRQAESGPLADRLGVAAPNIEPSVGMSPVYDRRCGRCVSCSWQQPVDGPDEIGLVEWLLEKAIGNDGGAAQRHFRRDAGAAGRDRDLPRPVRHGVQHGTERALRADHVVDQQDFCRVRCSWCRIALEMVGPRQPPLGSSGS
jgi:hypothetical protein